jgi:hypothetical protein
LGIRFISISDLFVILPLGDFMADYKPRLSWKNTAILTGVITFMFNFMPLVVPEEYRKLQVKNYTKDINGDGFGDKVYVADTSGNLIKKYELRWKKGLGNDEFEKEGKTIRVYASHKPEDVLVDDFTGDGQPDIGYWLKRPYLASGFSETYGFYVLEGRGNGTFGKPRFKWKSMARPELLD